MLKKFFQEKNLHLFFEMSVILKGIHAVIEVVGGLALFVISQEFIVHTLYSITQEELNEDPRDFIATSLLSSASQFTVGGQHFAAFYLLSHGLLKGFLVANLLREKLWAYPAAIVVFGFFIVYQTYRYSITHSF
ncbi:MAG: DUF2127 domain-containing protein, partial [Candidatus Moraniibacteriota bacterium]